MKKMIIPRKDHEVYFFTLTEGIKKKQIKDFAFEQLDKLHPSFRTFSSVDIQQQVFNKKHWIMATVMKEETLTEYKIFNKKTVFYTNTSIAINNKDFVNRGINIINDESIGFDTDNNEPVSIPLELDNISNFKSIELKNLPVKHGVFNKKTSKWRIIPVFPSLAIILFISSAFFPTEKNNAIPQALPEALFIEPLSENKIIPSSIEILSEISSEIVKKEGRIISWRYNEENDPFITIQLQDIDILSAYQIGDRLEYLYPYNIQDVRYNDGKPSFTLFLNTEKDYMRPITASFPGQDITLQILANFKAKLLENDIYLVSEILPNASYRYYTITYTAKDWNLIRSLEIISEFCYRYQLTVKSMDITMNSDNNRFIVVSSFSYTEETLQTPALSHNEKNLIPIAFGYRDHVPVAARVVSVPVTGPEHRIIGSISDGSGQSTFYRDFNDGKLRIRGDM